MNQLSRQVMAPPTGHELSIPSHVESLAPALPAVLWRRRWSIILCALVCMAGAGLYLALATPIYRSTAQVTVERNGTRVSGEPQSYVPQSEGFFETQAEGFQSAPVVQRALDEVGYRNLRTFTALKGDPVDWLKRSGALKVEVARKSDVIAVSVDSPAASEAATLANAIVSAYVTEQSLHSRSTGAEIIRTLDAEREQTQKRRDARVQKMLQLKRDHHVLSLKDDPHANPVLERAASLAASVTSAEIATLELKGQREALEKALSDPTALAAFVEAQQMKVKESGDHEYDEMRSQLGQATLSLSMGLQAQGPNHPRVTAMQSVVDTLRQRITDKERVMAKAQLLSITTQIDAAESKERAMREALRLQQDQALDLSPAAVEYAQLEGEAQELEKQISAIDARTAEVHVNTATIGALDVRTIEPARIAATPVKPNRTLTLAAALLAGCVLGTGLALTREHRDARLHNPQEVLAQLGIPVIATVPHMNSGLSPVVRGQVVGLDAQSMVAEAYRGVRTSLTLGFAGEAKTILVASPAQGDGKSTTASNLAIAFAQAGERTLLLDCDLRQPVQHLIFEMDGSTGLTSAMSGEAKLTEAIRPTRVPGLHLLACGPLPANPSELLTCKSFKRLMRVLIRTFDRIVIDSPPLVRFTDASVLAASADVTLLVLRMNQAMRPLCEMALGRLEHVGARVLGAVANGGPSTPTAYYGRAWQYASHFSPNRVVSTAWSDPEPAPETSAVVRAPRSSKGESGEDFSEPLSLRSHTVQQMPKIPDEEWVAEPR